MRQGNMKPCLHAKNQPCLQAHSQPLHPGGGGGDGDDGDFCPGSLPILTEDSYEPTLKHALRS